MSSENKKRKGKNSFLYKGGEKLDGMKLKRVAYFTKQDRKRVKKAVEE